MRTILSVLAVVAGLFSFAGTASAEFAASLSKQTTGAVDFISPGERRARLEQGLLMDRVRNGRDGTVVNQKTTIYDTSTTFVDERCTAEEGGVCDRRTIDQSTGDRATQWQGVNVITTENSDGVTVTTDADATDSSNDLDQWSVLQRCENCPPIGGPRTE